MRQRALIGALIVVGAGAPAMATRLDSEDLKTAVAGKTVTIDTPIGLPITVNYGANGLMTGTAGTALAVYLGAPKDRGRWHVRNGKLCQKWFKWLSGDLTCLTLRQEGTKIYWHSDEGQSGTATIEAGPPEFDGVTASGLGLPPPPEAAAKTDTSLGEPTSQQVTSPKPVIAKPWPRAVSVHRSAPRQEQNEAEEPRLAHAIAPATRPKPMLASLAPVPLPIAKPAHEAPSAASAPEINPFEAVPYSMRLAVDAAAVGMLEHRWCHSNAFAKGPAAPARAVRFAAPELLSVPSLLAVAQEQAYEGELPLHDAACLTEEPGINVLAKLTVPDDQAH